MLGVKTEFAAFCLDRAIYRFATHVENELEDVEGDNKNEIQSKRLRILRKYLPKADGAPETGQFADPANRSI